MKLSQISTDEAAGVLCELTPFVNDIVSDEELLRELKIAVDKNGGMTRAQMVAAGVEKINKIVPILLRKKKYSVFGILGVLNGKEADEIGRQNFLVTAAQVRDVVCDKALLDFFQIVRGFGNERVIRAVIRAPRMGAVSIISVLPDIIMERYEMERYRAYLYECIRVIGENTAGLVKGGKYLPTTYDDVIHPKPQDNRTAEEIVADVVKKQDWR